MLLLHHWNYDIRSGMSMEERHNILKLSSWV